MNVIFALSNHILISNLSSTATLVTVTIEIDPDAEAVERQVQVMTPVGLSNSLSFTIEETTTPEITGLNPNSLELLNPPNMPYTFGMDISGTGLATAEAVVFSSGDFMAEITSATPTQVSAEVTVAAGAPFGNREVTVQTASGVTNSVTFEFRQLVPRPGKPGSGVQVSGLETRQSSRTAVKVSQNVLQSAVTHPILKHGSFSPKPSARSLQPQALSPGFQNPEPQISWDQTFVYDRFGNLTETVEGGQRRSISVNAQNNRLNGLGMVYDAVGNLIEDNGKLYTYDAENRMLTATVNGVTTNYFYDGEGKRIKKIVNGQVTRFVYGMGGELVAEYEGATVNPLAPTKEYLYGATGLLEVSERTPIKYLTPDHLGSTRVITDSTGQIMAKQNSTSNHSGFNS